jgi:5-aminolevulinate synthase
MIDYKKYTAENIQSLQDKNIYRKYPVINYDISNPPYADLVEDNNDAKKLRKVVVWGNNSYLNLNANKSLIKAKIEATKLYGCGSGGTRNILGNNSACELLEKQISEWYGKALALTHISALDANIGALYALGKYLPKTIIFSDERNHASMIDGIRLSKADKYIFKHKDLNELEEKLREVRSLSEDRAIIVAVESIYSMDGDIFPLEELVKIKKKYNFLIYLDEVHAVGLYGNKGSGIAEQIGVLENIDIICGTFGKALGVQGGFICGEKNIIDFIRHYSRNFIFTTSPSPDSLVTVSKAIEIVSGGEGEKLREKLFENLRYLKQKLNELEIKFIDNQTHILPIILGSEEKTKEVASKLMSDHNIAVTPIFYPTVPINSARLRINITPDHNQKLCDDLVRALKELL